MKSPHLDTLLMLLGAGAFFLLLGGCLLVVVFLLGSGAQGAKTPATPPADTGAETDPEAGWTVKTLVLLLGGPLIILTCLWWTGQALLHPKPAATSSRSHYGP